MLSSITPLGERGRRRRWGVTVAAYVIASAAGGAAIGAAFGAVGSAVTAVADPSAAATAAVLAALIAAGAAFDLRLLPWPLPTVHRQVNENWLHQYRGWFYGAGFGFQLGLGVVTIVTTFTLYAYLLIAGLSGSVAGGAAVGAAFGLGRAIPLLLGAGVRGADDLRRLHRRLQSSAAPVRRLSLAAMTITALAAVAVR